MAGVIFCLLIVTLRSGLKLIKSAFMPSPPEPDREAFSDRAIAVMGALVTGSPRLFDEDNRAFESFPARYVIPADVDDSGKPSLVDVVLRIGEPPENLSESVRAALHKIAEDEISQFNIRRPIPVEATDGRAFFAIDLEFPVSYLVQKRVHTETPFHPFLIDPAENGRVVPIPYWIAFSHETPDWGHWATPM